MKRFFKPKNNLRLLGIIAIAAIIGFSFAACGDEADPTSPPHIHSWGAWTVTTAATCETAGKETRTCVLDPTYKETRAVPINAEAHPWGEWTETTPPTETEDGEETRTCTHNGEHKETRIVVALGHTHEWGDMDNNKRAYGSRRRRGNQNLRFLTPIIKKLALSRR